MTAPLISHFTTVTSIEQERQRLAWILDGTNVATWEWNVQTGETRFDARWAQMIGYTLEELAPISIQTWLGQAHPDDLAESGARLQAHFRGETPHYICEARIRHRDGHWIWVLDRGRVATWTPDGQPEWMYGTHMDVSANRRIQEELRASQVLAEQAFALTGLGVWQVDLKTQTPIWSAAVRRLHEVPEDFQPTLESALDFYPAEARKQVTHAIEQAIGARRVWDLEVPFITAKGRSLWVRVVGQAEFEGEVAVRLVGAFQDVTARKQLEQALEQEREQLRVTLNSIGDGVITTDPEGTIRWLNPKAEQLSGWTSTQAAGQRLPEVFKTLHQETRIATPDPISECLRLGHAVELQADSVLIRRDGSELAIEDSAAPILGADGSLQGAVLVFRDVTQQRRAVRQWQFEARHDPLTGLKNRLGFEQALDLAYEGLLGNRQRSHCLMFMDLDHFKEVNDTAGHAVGDALLREVGAELRAHVRQQDIIGRLGGDEFAVILSDCSIEAGLQVARKLCSEVQHLNFVHAGRVLKVGASAGLVLLDHRWSNPADALKAADTACYAAKAQGRGGVVTAAPPNKEP